MARYLFIQAIVNKAAMAAQAAGAGADCDAIRFRHAIVDAADEDGAYLQGGRWSDANPPHLDGYRPDEELINDYAVKIGERR